MEGPAKAQGVHVEELKSGTNTPTVGGSTQLIDPGEVILIPTPTSDTRHPLNLPSWRKILVVANVSLFAATVTLMAASFGTILPSINKKYHENPKVNDLVTFPALFIGLGNLIFVPIAHSIGRRPVYLFSLTMLIACCIWAARSKSLESHIAARDILGLAAGQAEALCPIMVQEIYFLHQRANKIALFCGLQTLGTTTLTIASSYLANSIGWRWWYGVFAIINAVCLFRAIFTVVETKFDRAGYYQQDSAVSEASNGATLTHITTRHGVKLDYDTYPARSFWYDIASFHGEPKLIEAIQCWKQMAVVFWFPNVFWLVLCSGILLGVFVIFGAVFAGVLVAPPYNFSYDYVGFIFAGQVVVAFIVIPAQGHLSDYLTKWLSKRNGGIAEITLVPPFIVRIISTIIFGRACAHPTQWTWSAIVVPFNAEFYAFVGVIVASFTYCIDSYPSHSDACLVVLCFARRVISLGLSYGSLEFVQKQGYAGAFDICAIIMGVLGFLGIFVFFFGKKIRGVTQRFVSKLEQSSTERLRQRTSED